jgi:hypothetical protein
MAAVDMRSGKIETWAEGDTGIQANASLAQAFIQAQTRMRICLYVLAAFLSCVAGLVVVFSPSGRETVSAIIAAALFVLAVGSAGFSTFAIKTPILSAQGGMSQDSDTHADRNDVPRHKAA